MQENRETFPVVELQTVLEMPAGQFFRIFNETQPPNFSIGRSQVIRSGKNGVAF